MRGPHHAGDRAPPATIIHADRILVVENGAIAESGRHDELLRKGGRYASFYRLQIREQERRRRRIAALPANA